MGNIRSRVLDRYPEEVFIQVDKITSVALGKEVLKRCGDEDQQKKLNETRKATLKFLKAATSFIPHAMDAGADLTNAAFIFAQPGSEFVIKAGGGDWEFYFTEESDGEIRGHCVRIGSFCRWAWDKSVGNFARILGGFVVSAVLPAVWGHVSQRLMPPQQNS
ncbi:hypothetical protein ACROYT_G029045 [Oculina patagonica]